MLPYLLLKGININNREFLLSQYADDTQVFLDGSEKSLREALLILDTFYKMSGLKINFEKKSHLDWIPKSFRRQTISKV